jgi:hypothetical protein
MSKLLESLIEYQPEMLLVKKDDILAAIRAMEAGLGFSYEVLNRHDTDLGRTTRKNRLWAETIEQDIRLMEATIKTFREYLKTRITIVPGSTSSV